MDRQTTVASLTIAWDTIKSKIPDICAYNGDSRSYWIN